MSRVGAWLLPRGLIIQVHVLFFGGFRGRVKHILFLREARGVVLTGLHYSIIVTVPSDNTR